MLRMLLAHLRAAEGGATPTPAELAAVLGVTPALVETLLADLTRRGHLRRVGVSSDGSCAACPLAEGCGRSAAGCTGFALVKPQSSASASHCTNKRGTPGHNAGYSLSQWDGALRG